MAGKKTTKATKKQESESEDETYEVEKVLKHKRTGNKLEYQIKWKGYNERTWEDEGNVENAPDLVEQYWNTVSDDKQIERYKKGSKAYKDLLKEQEAAAARTPSKKKRRSSALKQEDEDDAEAEEEQPEKKKRGGRKSAVKEEKVEKPSKQKAARAPKKEPVEEPAAVEEQDVDMGDAEQLAEEFDEESVEDLIDWEEVYGAEESWEDLIESIETVEPISPDEDDEAAADNKGPIEFQVLLVWKLGTAAYTTGEDTPAQANGVVENGDKAADDKAAGDAPTEEAAGRDKAPAPFAGADPKPAEDASTKEGEATGEPEPAVDAAAADEAPAKTDTAPSAAAEVVDGAKEEDEPVADPNGVAADVRRKLSWVHGDVIRVKAPQACINFFTSHIRYRINGALVE
ncbi:hypothetical protein JCM10207_005816 [Rhodosporidiobolus poonsookiae]